MVKVILISQRELINQYGQIIDSLEHNYISFFQEYYTNSFIIPIPNNFQLLKTYLDGFHIDLVILSGGNNINPEDINQNIDVDNLCLNRDVIEKTLIHYCQENQIPIIGICRGMQMLNIYEKGTITYNLPGHIGEHVITFNRKEYVINSFHNHGIMTKDISEEYNPLIVFEDVVESFIHKRYNFLGLQWHPERDHSSLELFNYLESKYIGLKK